MSNGTRLVFQKIVKKSAGPVLQEIWKILDFCHSIIFTLFLFIPLCRVINIKIFKKNIKN